MTGGPLRLEFSQGVLFSEVRVDEARLAVLNAMSAADAGAIILTRTLCDSAQRRGGRWQATLCHVDGGSVPVAARECHRPLGGALPAPGDRQRRGAAAGQAQYLAGPTKIHARLWLPVPAS